MQLTDHEKSMRDGGEGHAKQKAMELLVRYGEALGAERFVDTNNVAGVPGSTNAFLANYFKERGFDASYDVIYSLFDLDSDEVVEVPRTQVYSCHLQGGMDPVEWETMGMSAEAHERFMTSEDAIAGHGIQLLKTCTPYLAGNVPVKGEHCAWMESSAVVFCNSVIGGRTNTEGRESTSAAMLTGKIPDWGFHRDECRYGDYRIDVEVPVDTVMDWGMLGYFVGDAVEENIPVLTGKMSQPNLIRHKHFGAAAASSGGVEMYHIIGITPEAPTLEAAFGPREPRESFVYDAAARRKVYDAINAVGSDPNVDFVMLGCPHYSIEQIWEVVKLLDGRKVSENCRLWIFTSRAVKAVADRNGYTKTIREAGGIVLTDTCSSISQSIPKGTRVAALDSAKQAHYLPAFMNIEAWFGSTADCVNAACTGRWEGEAP